ncbi:MAG: CZB domain-containing protein [Campylobacteraceae bacterium]|nr:CZB domain-containing protein [Campylobacteraceae bacterium]
MQNRTFVILAEIDHIIYKVKAYSTILNEKLDEKFTSDKECRLGKWYLEGDGKKHFGNAKSYPLIKKPHATVHNAVHNNINIIKNGFKPEQIDSIIANFAQMEEASNKLFDILDNITQEIS